MLKCQASFHSLFYCFQLEKSSRVNVLEEEVSILKSQLSLEQEQVSSFKALKDDLTKQLADLQDNVAQLQSSVDEKKNVLEKTEKDISEKSEEIETLKLQLSELQEKILTEVNLCEGLRQEISVKSEETKEFLTVFDQNVESLSSARSFVDSLLSCKQDLEVEGEKHAAEIKNLKDETSDLNLRIDMLTTSKIELENLNREYELQIKQQAREIEVLKEGDSMKGEEFETKTQSLLSQLSELEKVYSELSAEKETCDTMIEKLKENIQDTTQEKDKCIHELQNECATLKENIQEVTETKDKTIKTLKEEKEVLIQSNCELNSVLESERIDLTKKLENAMKSLETEKEHRMLFEDREHTLQAELNSIENKMAEKCSALDTSRLSEDALNQKCSQKDRIIDEFKHNVEELNQSLSVCEKERNDLSENCRLLDAKVLNLTSELELLRQEKDAIQGGASEKDSAIEKMIKDLQAANKNILELEQLLETEYKSKADLNGNIENMSKLIEQLNEEKKSIERANADLQGEVEKLIKSIDELSVTNEELSLTVKDLNERNSELDIKVTELTVETEQIVKDYESVIQDIRAEYDKQMDLLKQELDSLRTAERTRLDILTAELNTMREENANLLSKVSAIQHECDRKHENLYAMKHECDVLHEKLSDLENSLLSVQNSNKQLLVEKEELKSLTSDLSGKVDSLSQHETDLNSKIKLLHEEIQKRKSIEEKRSSHIDMVEGEIESKTKLLEQLKLEIDTVKDQNVGLEKEIASQYNNLRHKDGMIEELSDKCKGLLESLNSKSSVVESQQELIVKLREENAELLAQKKFAEKTLTMKDEESSSLLDQVNKLKDNLKEKTEVMKTLIAEKENTVIEHGRSNQLLHAKIATQHELLQKMEHDLEKEQLKIQDLNVLHAKLEKDLDQKCQEIENLYKDKENVVNDYEKITQALHDKIALENEEKLRLEHRIEDDCSSIEKLEKLLRKKNEEIESLVSEKENLIILQEHSELSLKEKTAALNEKIQTLEHDKEGGDTEIQRLKDFQAKLEIEHENKCEELEHVIETKVRSMTSLNDKLQQDLNAAKLNITMFDKRLNDAKSENDDLRSMLEKVQANFVEEETRNLSLVGEIKSMNAHYENKCEQFNQVLRQKEEILSQMNLCQNSLDTYRVENNDLKEEVKEFQTETKDLQSVLESLRLENASLHSKCEAVVKSLDEKKSEIVELNSSHAKYRSQCEEAIDSLTSDLHDYKAETSDVQHQLDLKEQEIREHWQTRVQCMENEIQEILSEFSTFKQQQAENVDMKNTEVEKLEKAVVDNNIELQQVKSVNESLTCTLEEIQKESELVKSTLEKDLTSKEESLTSLTAEVELLTENLNELDGRYKSDCQELSDRLKVEIDRHNSYVDDLRNQIGERESTILELKNESVHNNQLHKQEIEKLNELIRNQAKEISSLITRQETLELDKENDKQAFSELQGLFTSKEELVQKQSKELKDVTDKAKVLEDEVISLRTQVCHFEDCFLQSDQEKYSVEALLSVSTNANKQLIKDIELIKTAHQTACEAFQQEKVEALDEYKRKMKEADERFESIKQENFVLLQKLEKETALFNERISILKEQLQQLVNEGDDLRKAKEILKSEVNELTELNEKLLQDKVMARECVLEKDSTIQDISSSLEGFKKEVETLKQSHEMILSERKSLSDELLALENKCSEEKKEYQDRIAEIEQSLQVSKDESSSLKSLIENLKFEHEESLQTAEQDKTEYVEALRKKAEELSAVKDKLYRTETECSILEKSMHDTTLALKTKENEIDQLTEKVLQKESICKELKTYIIQEKNTVSDLETQIQLLSSSLSELESAHFSLTAEHKFQKMQLNNSQKESASLQFTLNTSLSEVHHLKLEKENLQQEICSQEKDKIKLQETVADLNKNMELQQLSNNSLADNFQVLSKEHEKITQEKTTLETETKNARDMLERTNGLLSLKVGEISEKEQELSQLHKSISEANEKIKNITEKNAKMEDILDSLQDQLGDREYELSNTMSKLLDKEKELMTSIQKVEEIDMALMEMQEQNSALTSKVSELEKELSLKQQEYSQLEGECNKVKHISQNLKEILGQRDIERSEDLASKETLLNQITDIEEKLRMNEIENLRLHQEAAENGHELHKLTEKIQDFEKQLTYWKESSDDLSGENDELKQRLVIADDVIEDLEAKVQSLNDEITAEKTLCNEREKKLEDSRQQTINFASEKDRVETVCTEQAKTIKELVQETSALKSEITELKHNLQSTTDEKTSSLTANEEMQNTLAIKDDIINGLRNDLEVKTENICKYAVEVKECKADLESKNLEIQTLKGSELENCDKIENLEMQVESLTEVRKSLESDLSQKSDAVDVLNCENIDLKTKVSKLERELNTSVSSSHDYRTSLKSIECSVQNQKDTIDRLQETVEDLSNELKECKESLINAKCSIEKQDIFKKKLEVENNHLKIQIETWRKEIKTKDEEIDRNEYEKSNALIEFEKLNITLNELQQGLSEKDNEISNLANNIQELEANLAKVKEERDLKIELLSENVTDLVTQMDTCVAQKSELQSELNDACSNLENTEAARDELEQKQRLCEDCLREKEKVLEDLKERHTALIHEHDELLMSVADQEKVNQDRNSQIERLTIERQELLLKLSEYEKTVTFKNSEINTLCDSVSILEEKIVDMNENIFNLEKKSENLKQTVNNVEEMNSQLKGEISVLNLNFDEIKNTLEEKNMELSNARVQISELLDTKEKLIEDVFDRNNQMSVMEHGLRDLTDANLSLRSEIAKLVAVKRKHEKQIERFEERIDESATKELDLRGILDDYSKQIESLQKEKENLQLYTEEILVEIRNKSEMLQNEKDAHTETKTAMENLFLQSSDKEQSFSTQISIVLEENNQLLSKFESSQAVNNKNLLISTSLGKKLVDITCENDTLRSQKDDIEKQLLEKFQWVSEIRSQCEDKDKLLTEKEKRITDLDKQNIMITSDFRNLQDQFKKILTDCDNLNLEKEQILSAKDLLLKESNRLQEENRILLEKNSLLEEQIHESLEHDKSRMADKLDEMDELTKENYNLKLQLKNAEVKSLAVIVGLETEKDSLTTQLEELTKKYEDGINKLKEEIKCKNQEKTVVQEIHEKMTASVCELSGNAGNIEEKILVLIQEGEAKDSEMLELKHNISDLKVNLITLTEEKVMLQRSLEEKMEVIDEQKDEIVELKMVNDKVNNVLEVAQCDRKMLEKKLNVASEKADQMTSYSLDCEKRIESILRKSRELSDRLEHKDAEITRLMSCVDEQSEKIASLHETFTSKQNENAVLSSAYSVLSEEALSEKAILSHMMIEFNNLKNKFTNLIDSLIEKDENISTLKAKLESEECLNEELRENLTEKECKVNLLQEEIDFLTKSCFERETEITILKEKRRETENVNIVLTEKQREYSLQQESELDVMKQKLAAMQEEIKLSYEKELKYARKEDEFCSSVENKDVQIEYLIQSSSCMKETIKRKDTEIDELKEVVKNLESLVKELEISLEQNRSEIAETNQHLEVNMVKENKEKKSLENKVKVAKEIKAQLENELIEKDSEIAVLNENLAAEIKRICTLNEENRNLEYQFQIVKGSLEQEVENNYSECAAINKERKVMEELRQSLTFMEKVNIQIVVYIL